MAVEIIAAKVPSLWPITAEVNTQNIGFILAVGGGSVLDASKFISPICRRTDKAGDVSIRFVFAVAKFKMTEDNSPSGIKTVAGSFIHSGFISAKVFSISQR